MQKLFNDGWEFKLIKPDKTETEWKPVDIPHDWQIYDADNLYEDGEGWYRKIFDNSENMRTFFRFDGVYMDTAIWINDVQAFTWKYGYSTFEFEVTEYLARGQNEIKVRTDLKHPNSRWYSGAGIYRNVWVITKPLSYLPSYGTYIHTEHINDRDFSVSISTETYLADERKYSVSYMVMDKDDRVIVSETGSTEFTVENATLWDIGNPYLYTLTVRLYIESNENAEDSMANYTARTLLDTEKIRFGFRTVKYDTDGGFFLNGRHVKLKGVCMHHDLGCLGAAVNTCAIKRQLDIMKSMGVNAVRTSHNPPAPELMELAAEEGILIDSECFDMWEIQKTDYDYGRFFPEWYKKDVASWIRRDRNNPAVIMWSIGNEIGDTNTLRGRIITKALMDEVHLHDSRINAPVTMGSNYMPWENGQKCADILKLIGYNYSEKYYEEHHRAYPDWMIYGSETASVVYSRGIYHFPADKEILAENDLQCSSMLNSMTSWGAKSVEKCITDDRDAKMSAGMFIWTGFDYIGEPTPYHTRNSYFGQVDTAGFAKDAFYVYQAAWVDYKDKPMVHLFPYWDFNPGQIIDVMIASNCPKVELFVNGRSEGVRKIDVKHDKEFVARWKIAYKKGRIRAVAYDENDKVLVTDERKSFGDAYEIAVEPDKTVIKADGEDLAFVTIFVKDKDGNPVSNATNRINVSVSGAGRLMGLDNGDSTDMDGYKVCSKRLFSGKLLCVIGAKTEPGQIKLTVSSPGLDDICIGIDAAASDVRDGISANEAVACCKTQSVLSEIPVRKLEITAENDTMTKDNPSAVVCVNRYPENASYTDIEYLITNEYGVEIDIAQVDMLEDDGKVQTAKQSSLADCKCARIIAKGDGDFYLKCQCKNGTDHADIMSQREFHIEGLGKKCLSPYKFIFASQKSEGSDNLATGNEKGISTAIDGRSYFAFDNLDFGENGSDRITIPVFELDSCPLYFEIWEGTPNEAESVKLLDAVYDKKSIWNTYQEETYTLNKKLTGVKKLGFVFERKAHIKGFVFD